MNAQKKETQDTKMKDEPESKEDDEDEDEDDDEETCVQAELPKTASWLTRPYRFVVESIVDHRSDFEDVCRRPRMV